MAVSASQTVHANELQTPSQSDSAIQKADNDVATDNDQSNNTAHVVNHVDPNSNLQQNDNKRTANVATDSNENTVGGWSTTTKDASNKLQENVNAFADQKDQATVAFAVKKSQ